MAMTKKEQATLDAALEESRILRALRWSEAKNIARDVPPPSEWKEYSDGWSYFTRSLSVDFGSVERMWSSSNNHGYRDDEGNIPKHSSVQNPMSLFSTRSLALRALRVELERKYAENLARVDKWIAEDEADAA